MTHVDEFGIVTFLKKCEEIENEFLNAGGIYSLGYDVNYNQYTKRWMASATIYKTGEAFVSVYSTGHSHISLARLNDDWYYNEFLDFLAGLQDEASKIKLELGVAKERLSKTQREVELLEGKLKALKKDAN